MSLPKGELIIGKDGTLTIDGQEKSASCFKWTDLAKDAGKVIEDKSKDHTPVHQTVHRKGA